MALALIPEFELIPPQASTFADEIDLTYLFLWLMTIFFTGAVYLLVFIAVIKYRRRAPDEIPRPTAGSIKFEIIVSSAIFLIFIGAFAAGVYTYYLQYRVPADANFEVQVLGKQWMWQFQHPTGEREINELHVPVNTKIKLVMTSEDVIHSLYFPAFRTKSDVVPGYFTTFWFEATQEGTYRLFCTEYCGTNHSGMNGRVIVMKQTDYQNWIAGNPNQLSPVAAGRELFNRLGCVSCHGEGAVGGRCPPLVNLYGERVQLRDGTTVTANENYLRESILQPQAKLVDGYPNIMPTYQGQITQEQLLQLITFIKGISPRRTDAIDATQPARSNNPRAAPPTLDAQGAGEPKSLRSNPVGQTPPGNIEGERGRQDPQRRSERERNQ